MEKSEKKIWSRPTVKGLDIKKITEGGIQTTTEVGSKTNAS